ncbi:MAG: exosortase C-terminal domain/associated protein EpsI [Terriglobales bacterium]
MASKLGGRHLNTNYRFAIAAVILIAASVFLHARGGSETLPAHLPLSSFPATLKDWDGTDMTIPKNSLDVLGPGDFLLRDYQNKSSAVPDVTLFVAFFPSQQAGDTIHSPKNCLPGSGWYPLESSKMNLSVPGHEPFPVNRYIIAKGTDRELVLYWYWAHNRGVASEYWAKFYLVSDSIRLHRSDGSLVRLTTPITPDEGAAHAQRRLVTFAETFVPVLNQYIPR